MVFNFSEYSPTAFALASNSSLSFNSAYVCSDIVSLFHMSFIASMAFFWASMAASCSFVNFVTATISFLYTIHESLKTTTELFRPPTSFEIALKSFSIAAAFNEFNLSCNCFNKYSASAIFLFFSSVKSQD